MGISARKVHSYDLYSGHAWYVPGIKGMFALLGFFLLGTLLGSLVSKTMLLFMAENGDTQLYCYLIAYPVSFIPPMVHAASQSRKNMGFFPGYSLDNKHFGPLGIGGAIVLAIVLAFASMFVLDLPNYGLMKLTYQSEFLTECYNFFIENLGGVLHGPVWASFLLAAIFAPVFEEWFFRGMVLRGLLTKMKPVWAIVISALLFAFVHFNPWQGLYAFLIALVMGFVYYKTGSLILTMLMHFVLNGTSLVVSNIESLKDYEDVFWIEVMDKPFYFIVFALCCVVIAACLYAFSRIKLENPWGNIDRIPTADEIAAAETTPAE